ncbi:hypothetical protein J2S49_001165 [Arcanobacterium wilhelmae]|uniref:Type II secretion system protein GspF domain-containing protein n=1 Tax=Arcanobacterium wilhelmae TaxID=1803177 RepID=A0ABT9NBJ4_9ACTO|nr:hypothetical protein [Arcanobacterium wilhelmae]MDP9801089.1 hypothetical protein [Arcanobacterium wilhelmae]WFN90445.1 hypothetical protein P8A24_00860 [Arcanobacterium wilhelmae]
MIVILCAAVGLVWLVPAGVRSVRRARPEGNVDPAVVLDLAVAALAAGVSIPSCLRAVDHALARTNGSGGADVGVLPWRARKLADREASLSEVAGRLVMGASWDDAWEGSWEGFCRLRDALAPAWLDGAAPVPLLQRSAQTLRVTRARRAKEAAAKLGSQLVVPLGLCFLPAFVLLGVVPVVVSFAEKLL